jgi:acyl-CoA synthetase (AMP-forming)/AMP-acid ligase II
MMLRCFQYTGGTTGIAKGAQLSHAKYCCAQLDDYRIGFIPTSETIKLMQEIIITAIPDVPHFCTHREWCANV